MAVLGVGRDPAKLESMTADLSPVEPGAADRLATMAVDVTAKDAPGRIAAGGHNLIRALKHSWRGFTPTNRT
jgi:hypothetical protein